ncbi:MAG: HhH-GPD family protein [Anaerolineaceae bacterium]
MMTDTISNHLKTIKDVGFVLAQSEFETDELIPWRINRTPYRIFLAELLLVRTRFDVVAKLYDKIFNHYPNIESLAKADIYDLQKELYSLGLKKRVPYIIKAANFIFKEYNSEIPTNYDMLQNIPGLGQYSASAILAFGYGQNIIPNDVNIIRFISRITGITALSKTKGSKLLTDLSREFVTNFNGNQAEKLLDFTRLICRTRKPKCTGCVIVKHCVFFREVNK